MQKLITQKGFLKLKSEFDELSLKERPKVVMGVSDAAAEGDRSENAEYIYGKKRLREIDKRLAYLSKILKDVKIVKKNDVQTKTVEFGTKVKLRDEEGNIKIFTIVGEGEADLKEQSISHKALVALAILGKKLNDIVEVELPHGIREYEILSITQGEID